MATSKVETNKSKSTTIAYPVKFINTGKLSQGLLRPLFLVGGINFLSIGYRSLSPLPLPAPKALFNGTTIIPPPRSPTNISLAFAQSCELLLRSSCKNGSFLKDELRWNDASTSFQKNCSATPFFSISLLAQVYNILFDHDLNRSMMLTDVIDYFANFNGSGYFNVNGSRVAPHNITSRSLVDLFNCSASAAHPPRHTTTAPPIHEIINKPIVTTAQVNIHLDGPVRALSTVMGRVFVGGGFQKILGAGYSVPLVVNHVFEFTNIGSVGIGGDGGISKDGDGRGQRSRSGSGYKTPLVESLGDGTDGPVHSMTSYHNMIVIGGSFGQVYPVEGNPIISGGLAAWNPIKAEWLLIDRTPLRDAIVSQVKSYRNVLYIVGRFKDVGGSKNVNHVAMHRGDSTTAGGWSGFLTGLHGGHAVCLAFIGNEMIVGGTFERAGETLMENIARWDGRQWQRMANKNCARQCDLSNGPDRFMCKEHNCELDGMVTALAANGGSVYAAGQFQLAGAHPAHGITQYYRSIPPHT